MIMGNKKILYAILIALFAIAASYQVRYTPRRLLYLLSADRMAVLPLNTEPLSPKIGYVGEQAKEAGVHKGDRLLAVDDRPYVGKGVLADRLVDARPGDPVTVRIEHAEAEAANREETFTLQFPASTEELTGISNWLFFIVLILVMPIFCLLLGFWVAAIRPRDPLAWILLALMLGFGFFIPGIDPYTFKGVARDVVVGYFTFFETAWPLWMLLFGIYFPERLVYDRRWPWAKWLVIAPLLFFSVSGVIIEVGGLENFAAAAPLSRMLRPYNRLRMIIGMVAIGCFFMSLGIKQGTATSPDVRRRLRLLELGAGVSLTPTFLIALYSIIARKELYQAVPTWVALPSLLLLFVFPLTLAYAIVVHRAMDVRVVIRQGVQYAFARGGILALRLIVIFIIIFVMIWQIKQPEVRAVDISIILGVGLTLIFAMKPLGDRLTRWTDRKFFREAYNSEQILSELSEKVRTMVETRPLLETVAERISQSLHVPRTALLTKTDGAYRTAHAIGYSGVPEVAFPERAATIERLRQEKQPVRVYLDETESWVNVTPGIDGERHMLKMLDTQLLLPLAVKEEMPGLISLGPKQSEEPYSSADLRLLQSVATQTGLALENSQLTEAIAREVAQRERLNRELEIAREVQERLFPQKLPPILGLDYCGACRPALGVGGDYYDFLLLPNNKFGIAIGDVSGKGIAAALLMASLQASLRGQAIRGTNDLADLMGNVNRLVYDASAENRYATFFYAQYDPTTRKLIYVNAGHNPPMLFRKQDGATRIIRLEEGGAVVGLLRDFPYTHAEVNMEPGDLLVAFTDGISEAMNTADEEWGEDRLIETTEKCDGMTAADMISRIVEAADRFAAGAKQHDDMTLLIVRAV
jgi:sigma-B regulation protein RsbU (phosphoserine phosphatase)